MDCKGDSYGHRQVYCLVRHLVAYGNSYGDRHIAKHSHENHEDSLVDRADDLSLRSSTTILRAAGWFLAAVGSGCETHRFSFFLFILFSLFFIDSLISVKLRVILRVILCVMSEF